MTTIPFPPELIPFKSQLDPLLDENEIPIGPLFNAFFQNFKDNYSLRYNIQYQDVQTNILSWLFDHNIDTKHLHSLFDSILLRLGHLKDKIYDDWLNTIIKITNKHPEKMQKLWELHPAKMDPSYIIMVYTYAPRPLDVWLAHPEWQQECDKFNGTVVFSQKLESRYILKNYVLHKFAIKELFKDLPQKTAANITRSLILQSLPLFNYTDIEGGGNSYHVGVTLKNILFQVIEFDKELKPHELFKLINTKYKGKKLIKDSIEGASWALDYADINGYSNVQDYCNCLLNSMLPLAIKEGLHADNEANIIDHVVERLGASGKISAASVEQWWDVRIPLIKHKSYSLNPRYWNIDNWPAAQKKSFVLKINKFFMGLSNGKKSYDQHIYSVIKQALKELDNIKLQNTLIEELPENQWQIFCSNLIKKENTTKNNDLSLLVDLLSNIKTTRIQTLFNTPEVRILIVRACLAYILNHKNVENLNEDDKYLASFLIAEAKYNRHDLPLLGTKSIPDPFCVLAKIYPQYIRTFQDASLKLLSVPSNELETITHVLNKICSILLNANINLIEASHLVESLGVPTQDIISAMFINKDEYSLPSQLFENSL